MSIPPVGSNTPTPNSALNPDTTRGISFTTDSIENMSLTSYLNYVSRSRQTHKENLYALEQSDPSILRKLVFAATDKATSLLSTLNNLLGIMILRADDWGDINDAQTLEQTNISNYNVNIGTIKALIYDPAVAQFNSIQPPTTQSRNDLTNSLISANQLITQFKTAFNQTVDSYNSTMASIPSAGYLVIPDHPTIPHATTALIQILNPITTPPAFPATGAPTINLIAAAPDTLTVITVYYPQALQSLIAQLGPLLSVIRTTNGILLQQFIQSHQLHDTNEDIALPSSFVKKMPPVFFSSTSTLSTGSSSSLLGASLGLTAPLFNQVLSFNMYNSLANVQDKTKSTTTESSNSSSPLQQAVGQLQALPLLLLDTIIQSAGAHAEHTSDENNIDSNKHPASFNTVSGAALANSTHKFIHSGATERGVSAIIDNIPNLSDEEKSTHVKAFTAATKLSLLHLSLFHLAASTGIPDLFPHVIGNILGAPPLANLLASNETLAVNELLTSPKSLLLLKSAISNTLSESIDKTKAESIANDIVNIIALGGNVTSIEGLRKAVVDALRTLGIDEPIAQAVAGAAVNFAQTEFALPFLDRGFSPKNLAALIPSLPQEGSAGGLFPAGLNTVSASLVGILVANGNIDKDKATNLINAGLQIVVQEGLPNSLSALTVNLTDAFKDQGIGALVASQLANAALSFASPTLALSAPEVVSGLADTLVASSPTAISKENATALINNALSTITPSDANLVAALTQAFTTQGISAPIAAQLSNQAVAAISTGTAAPIAHGAPIARGAPNARGATASAPSTTSTQAPEATPAFLAALKNTLQSAPVSIRDFISSLSTELGIQGVPQSQATNLASQTAQLLGPTAPASTTPGQSTIASAALAPADLSEAINNFIVQQVAPELDPFKAHTIAAQVSDTALSIAEAFNEQILILNQLRKEDAIKAFYKNASLLSIHSLPLQVLDRVINTQIKVIKESITAYMHPEKLEDLRNQDTRIGKGYIDIRI